MVSVWMTVPPSMPPPIPEPQSFFSHSLKYIMNYDPRIGLQINCAPWKRGVQRTRGNAYNFWAYISLYVESFAENHSDWLRFA